MSDQENLNPADEELARALGGLTPSRPGLSRERLLFQAGAASARRARRPWQCGTVVLAAALAISLATRPHRPTPQPGPAPAPAVVRHSPAARPAPPAASGLRSYFEIRETALNEGIDAVLNGGEGSDGLSPRLKRPTRRGRLFGPGLFGLGRES